MKKNEPDEVVFVTSDHALRETTGLDQKVFLNSRDEEAFRIVRENNGGVQLTPQLMKRMQDIMKMRRVSQDTTLPELADACPPEMKMAVVCWFIRHLLQHATEGGTYRYMIYDRLNFGEDCYMPLQNAGLLDICNALNLKGNDNG